MISPMKRVSLGNNTLNHHIISLYQFSNHESNSLCVKIEMVDSVTLSVPGDRSSSFN